MARAADEGLDDRAEMAPFDDIETAEPPGGQAGEEARSRAGQEQKGTAGLEVASQPAGVVAEEGFVTREVVGFDDGSESGGIGGDHRGRTRGRGLDRLRQWLGFRMHPQQVIGIRDEQRLPRLQVETDLDDNAGERAQAGIEVGDHGGARIHHEGMEAQSESCGPGPGNLVGGQLAGATRRARYSSRERAHRPPRQAGFGNPACSAGGPSGEWRLAETGFVVSVGAIPTPMKRLLRPGLAALSLCLVFGAALPLGAQVPGSLEAEFRNPPESARPRTWWHWTRSNVSREGITKDLEWMKRVGIAGFMLADVNFGRGQEVEPKTPFGTPEWYQAVRHAAMEADRLGLEMSIFSSPGWSETGGPWVKPEQAMKKLVWSETRISGPVKFSGKLSAPPSNIGQIRNTGVSYYSSDSKESPFYADSAVVAYRTPAGETAAAPRPTVTTNRGAIDGTALLDDDLNTQLTLPAGDGASGAPAQPGAAWVQYEFAEPFTARAITLGGKGGSANGIPVGRVLASADGKEFSPLLTLPGAQLYRQGMVRTFAFPPVTARVFRIELTGAPIGPAATMSQAPAQPAAQYVLSEAVLHAGARVHRWEEKAGFSFLFEYGTVATPAAPGEATIASSDVIDLTGKMKSDGTLDWEAPTGEWTVLRLGYSLTGAKTRPATPSGSGLEADKLSRKHMEAYYHGYFDPLQQALGPLFGKSLRYVMMDSWEAGTNNWSDELAAEFKQRRGYDPTPWLPVLTGRVVENAELSDRFLWDFRRTLADLWADAHYGTMADKLREHGIGIYAEAAGVSLEMPEDTLLNKSKVEIPMGEFWVRDLHPRLMYLQDVRGAASAAHVYGKKLVGAEAFTGGGYESPYTLKKVADYWMTQGVNRLVFHTSAHQPQDSKPGNTMVGTHLNRNITWAEQAGPLMDYFSRSSHLLQQGLFVADLAYLLDEGAPSTPPIWGAGTQPAPPEGHDFDFISADVLLKRLTVAEDGRLVLPDGMSYRVLVLPDTEQMRPELLRKLQELVAGGATISGRRPVRSPSLAGYPAADVDVRTLAAELWGDLDGVSRTIRHVGKGRVVWGRALAETLTTLGVAKDFDYAKGLDAEVNWLHRRTPEADIYFVVNATDQAREFEARFRVTGKEAELWHPDTGLIERVRYASTGDRTVVPLRLAERESVFVVFRRKATEWRPAAVPTEVAVLATLEGPWSVTFPEGLGAPARIELARLGAWSSHADPGVKFFSGTATYSKTITASPAWFLAGTGLFLDLGGVGDMAEVSVNGRRLPLLWKAPWQVDVTGALQPGENRIEIRVTNQWTNRLAGDRELPAEKQVLADPGPPFGNRVPPPPPESGLFGPVVLVRKPVARVADSPDGKVAEIPANYTEAKVGGYTLPGPLRSADGQTVNDARTWEQKRRPELLALFETNQFGQVPGRPAEMTFEVTEAGAPAFAGKAIRRQVTVHFSKDRTAGPRAEVLLYLPAEAKGPVPVILQASFTANNLAVEDAGVRVGRIWNREQKQRVPASEGRRFGRLDVDATVARGFGVATVNYGDFEPDVPGAIAHGVRQAYLKPGQAEPAADEWGTISAWSWGLSRVMDYLETDKDVDAKRVALFGVSRLGKTVLWTGARDSRFAAIIASCSGEGGAAVSRRDYGETVAHLTAPTRYPYQFAANYGKWAGKATESPVEANLLVSLIAPRPLLLQTGTTDIWSDPVGEFVAAVSATPVYRLLGKDGLETDQMPQAGQVVGGTVAYYMHEGGHGTIPSDWAVFLDFLEREMR